MWGVRVPQNEKPSVESKSPLLRTLPHSVLASPASMLQSSRSIVSATSGRSIRSARPGASRPSLRTQTPGSRSIGRRTSAHTQKREFTQAIAFAKELSSAFWNGSKALYANFRDSRILKQRREAGETLTRPEIRLIDRTNDDLWVRLKNCDSSLLFGTLCEDLPLPFISAFLTTLPCYSLNSFRNWPLCSS